MPGAISYYFTLFKKFQVINHVPEGTVHGAGVGGFNLNDPNSVFGSAALGKLLGATTNPADSPLWAVLNSRAMGNRAFTPVTVGGKTGHHAGRPIAEGVDGPARGRVTESR